MNLDLAVYWNILVKLTVGAEVTYFIGIFVVRGVDPLGYNTQNSGQFYVNIISLNRCAQTIASRLQVALNSW